MKGGVVRHENENTWEEAQRLHKDRVLRKARHMSNLFNIRNNYCRCHGVNPLDLPPMHPVSGVGEKKVKVSETHRLRDILVILGGIAIISFPPCLSFFYGETRPDEIAAMVMVGYLISIPYWLMATLCMD